MKACVSFLARTVPVLALLFVTACPGAVDPAPVACSGDGGTSALATWANVRDVVDNGCHGSDCHTKGERALVLLDTASAPLSDADLYKNLTTYTTTKCGA